MRAGFTLLLIENEPNDAELFRIAVENCHLEINLQTVEDGQGAMDYLLGRGAYAERWSHPVPDVIVMDLHMPRRNGFEVLSWLHDSRPFQHLPVVILSGSVNANEREQACRLGASRFMVKPLGLPQLEQTVREIGEFHQAFDRRAHSEAAPR